MMSPLDQGIPTLIGLGVLSALCLLIGYGYPGVGGKVLAGVICALPFLAVALFVSIAEATYGGVSGQEPAYRGAQRVLLDAAIAAMAGVALAVCGGLLHRLRRDV